MAAFVASETARSRLHAIAIAFLQSLRLPPRITLSQWSDQHGWISSESSDYIGPWKTSYIPYMREPMDALSDPLIPSVDIVGCAQGAKTSIVLQFLAYTIKVDPGPFLWVMPSGETADRFSKDRVEPLFRDTPCLQGLVAEAKSRFSDNTILHKRYYGGRFRLASAGSPAALAQSPERYLVLDDISNFPQTAKAQGNPLGIAEKRTRTFRNRKVVRLGTPTNEGECWVTYYYEKTDMRKYQVPCPFCRTRQVLEFEQLQHEVIVTDTDEIKYRVWYECKHCKEKITEDKKKAMIDQGEWVPEKPGRKARGYWFSALYVPWTSWVELIEEYEEVKEDPEALKQFTNLELGKVWKVQAESAPGWKFLLDRREAYSGRNLPTNKIQKITLGADVQIDRIIYTVIGWGADFEAWVLSDGEVEGFEELTRVLESEWVLPNGKKKKISLSLIDSGYRTDEVFDWVFKHNPNRVRAIKGEQHWTSLFSFTRVERGAKSGKPLRKNILWHLDTYRLKSKLYRLLSKKPSQSGYFHLGQETDERFVKELTNERLVQVKKARGRITYEWEQTGPNHRHDTCVYALAGAYMVGVRDLIPLEESEELKMVDPKNEEDKRSAPISSPEQAENKPTIPKKPGNSGFVRKVLSRGRR